MPASPAVPDDVEPTPISLLVESPAGERAHVDVDRDPFVIGRLRTCDLALLDSRISRRHARIRVESGSYRIEDLGSRNGLVVNGKRSHGQIVVAGDHIDFGMAGSYRITVCEGGVPKARLLKRVSSLSAPGRAGALSQLSAMLEVARTMESSAGLDEVFASVLEAALTITHAERAFLLLRDNMGRLEVKLARDADGVDLAGSDLEVPRSVIANALEERRGVLSATVIGDQAGDRDDCRETDGALDLRSSVCVPILPMRVGWDPETTAISAKDNSLGALYLDTRDPGTRLAERNRALLQALAIDISSVLENARLIEQEREKRRLELEIRTARSIQRSLLPAVLPGEGWLVAKARCEPSLPVGGDYYDLMQTVPGQWAAVVADVSGKGVAASILAALLQGAFFLGAGPSVSLSGTLGRINRYLCERSSQSRFVTVFALTLDRGGAMQWSSAGHCPAILARRSGALEWLRPNSFPVGVVVEAKFEEETCLLEAGDKLVIYSDGLTELRNDSGEQFGEERLESAVAKLAGRGSASLFEGILAEASEFAGETPRADDLTLLVLGFEGDSAEAGGCP